MFLWFLDDAECELNCRPINQKYFAKLKEYAVDGTHCTNLHDKPKNHSNSTTKAVCVEGKCRVSKINWCMSLICIDQLWVVVSIKDHCS